MTIENNIKDRIKEIAQSVGADYPNINELSTEEYLYVIEQTLDGWNAALSDWQVFGDNVIKTYKPNPYDVRKLWGNNNEFIHHYLVRRCLHIY